MGSLEFRTIAEEARSVVGGILAQYAMNPFEAEGPVMSYLASVGLYTNEARIQVTEGGIVTISGTMIESSLCFTLSTVSRARKTCICVTPDGSVIVGGRVIKFSSCVPTVGIA